nr:AMP-binding protein [Amylibacter sp.]
MNRLHWHPRATLSDFDGTRMDAAQAAGIAPRRSSDPATPLIAIPAFLNALGAGFSPIIGPATDAPDQRDSFFTLTGGTTGAPKVIRRRAQSWLHSIKTLSHLFGIGPNARVATLGNLTYSLSLYAAIEAIHCGADFHFLRGAEINSRGITHLYATPTQLRLIRQPAPGVTHVITGGGPYDEATASHVGRIFPNAKVWRFYGAAETSFITLADKTAPEGSVGPAFPGVTICIRDAAGLPVAANTPGLVWLRSPMLFTAYASGVIDSTKWNGDEFSVGEVGYLDPSGNLFLTGRADRILTIADQSVSLDQLETALIAAGAGSAAIIALPDPLRGYILHGFVEGSVPKPSLLKSMTQLPALPRRASGKPDYSALRKLII